MGLEYVIFDWHNIGYGMGILWDGRYRYMIKLTYTTMNPNFSYKPDQYQKLTPTWP